MSSNPPTPARQCGLYLFAASARRGGLGAARAGGGRRGRRSPVAARAPHRLRRRRHRRPAVEVSTRGVNGNFCSHVKRALVFPRKFPVVTCRGRSEAWAALNHTAAYMSQLGRVIPIQVNAISVSVTYRTGLGYAETEIGKWRPETGAAKPPVQRRKSGICRPETWAHQHNPRECRQFSHSRKSQFCSRPSRRPSWSSMSRGRARRLRHGLHRSARARRRGQRMT